MGDAARIREIFRFREINGASVDAHSALGAALGAAEGETLVDAGEERPSRADASV